MTVYADYMYYTDTFRGTVLSEEDFSSYALRASLYINYATLGRAEKHSDMEEVKLACCAIAEQFKTIDTAYELSRSALSAGVSSLSSGSTELQSQTVGNWSKSYRSGGDSSKSALSAAESAQAQLENLLRLYLGATGLLKARGFYAI